MGSQVYNPHLLPHPDALTVNGQSIDENCASFQTMNKKVIRTVAEPIQESAGFINLKGNLFESAIMKTSVIGDEFRARYLSNPDDPNAFEGCAVVFDRPEDFHARIDDPEEMIDQSCILVMRGTGPKGYPGGAEVVNMRAPSYLLQKGVSELPCIGDGRQSGTSGSPSILNASPEAAENGGLALLKNGDKIRIDLNRGEAQILVDEKELMRRQAKLDSDGGATEFQKAKRRGSRSFAKMSAN